MKNHMCFRCACCEESQYVKVEDVNNYMLCECGWRQDLMFSGLDDLKTHVSENVDYKKNQVFCEYG